MENLTRFFLFFLLFLELDLSLLLIFFLYLCIYVPVIIDAAEEYFIDLQYTEHAGFRRNGYPG